MKNISFYLITIILFIGLSNELWSDGMFMDGLYYAAIARNLSLGVGSFWQLYFTELDGVFCGHPPLAIGLQSIFFSIFGDNIYVERFYSLSTFIITGIFIHLIWKEIIEKKYIHLSWVPILFWITIPLNGWASANNFLENTMNIFVSASVLFAIKNIKTDKTKYIMLSALMIFLAFLSKGFTGIFPLSIFFWFYIIFAPEKRKTIIIKSILILAFLLSLFLFLFLFQQSSIESLLNYLNVQVIDSIKNSTINSNRFNIMRELANQMKLFHVISTITILFYLVIELLRKFGTTYLLKNNSELLIFIIALLILPIPTWNQQLLLIFTKYTILYSIIYFTLFLLIFYMICLKLYRSNLINNKKLINWIITLLTLSFLFFVSKLINNIIIIYLASLIILTIIYQFSRLFKKPFINKFLKSKILIIIFAFTVYYITTSTLKYQLFEVLNLYPYMSYSILILYLLICYFRKKNNLNLNTRNKWILLFLMLGISGVLPMIISLKQGGFYILTTLPFFSISIALLTIPIFNYLSSKLDTKFVVLTLISLFLYLGPFVSSSTNFLIPYTRYIKFNSIKYQYKIIARDKPLLEDIYVILNQTKKNTIINIDFRKNWNIHGYFARYGNIGLDINPKIKNRYLISFEDGWNYDERTGKYVLKTTDFQLSQTKFKKNYSRVEIATKKLHLYEYIH